MNKVKSHIKSHIKFTTNRVNFMISDRSNINVFVSLNICEDSHWSFLNIPA